MAEVRYQVPGVPPGPAAGMTAFLPHFNRAAAGGAQSYKYAVSGHPGTRRIPAPTLNTQMQPDEGDKAQMGTARSSDAPQAWWPQQYYQRFLAERPGAGMPVAVYSPTQPGRTTLLPVPSRDLGIVGRSDSARLARATLLNRVRQLPWFPRVYSAPDG